MKTKFAVTVGAVVLASLLIFSSLNTGGSLRGESVIDPDNIEILMREQVELGPRHPGTQGSLDFKDWVFSKVSDDWKIEVQNFTFMEIELRNYWITSADATSWPPYLVGAHYDSRKVADKDPNPENRDKPVPGANDGGSGVAGILEMMNHIPADDRLKMGFILFDGEDQGSGGMDGWPWIVGSKYFVNQMSDEEVNNTEFFVLLDMIADDELIMEFEPSSDDEINQAIWNTAHDLGYHDIFKMRDYRFSIIDDHRPFLDRGIPAVDLIDLDYPEHHTVDDTMENSSPENAAIVVDVVFEWFMSDYFGEYSVISSSIDTDANYPLHLSGLLVILILFRHFNKKITR